MNNTGEFIISLAKQSGVELDEAQTKAISDIATDLPDDIAAQIQGNLFTKESALANPDIISKLKADSLDPVDAKLVEMAKGAGLDEGFIHNLKDTKGTYNRMDSVGKAILQNHKAALEKAVESAGGGDSKELKSEITKLNKQIADHNENTVTQADHEAMIDKHNGVIAENARAILQMKANELFAGKVWAMDKVSNQVNTATGLGVLNAELISKGIKLVDANGILKLETNEGSPYFNTENKEVTPQDLVDTLLARENLLKVTDTSTKTPISTTVLGNGDVDPSVLAAVAKAQESMENIQKLQERTA